MSIRTSTVDDSAPPGQMHTSTHGGDDHADIDTTNETTATNGVDDILP